MSEENKLKNINPIDNQQIRSRKVSEENKLKNINPIDNQQIIECLYSYLYSHDQ